MTGMHDPALARVYAASRGPVAFIDESHDAVVGAGGVGFYTTAAVIVDRRQLEDLRTAILQAAGGRQWHTTDVFHAGHPERIAALATHLAEQVEWNIVATHAPMAGHTGADYLQARHSALTATLTEVTRGANPVRVVVLDTLGDPRADGADLGLGALLRGTGQIPSGTLLRHSDDKLEPLLAAPDVVAWATRRLLALDDRAAFDPLADVTTLLDASSRSPIDTRRLLAAVPPAAPSPPSRTAAAAIEASFPTPIGQVPARKAMASFLAQAAAAQTKAQASSNTPRPQNRSR